MRRDRNQRIEQKKSIEIRNERSRLGGKCSVQEETEAVGGSDDSQGDGLKRASKVFGN